MTSYIYFKKQLLKDKAIQNAYKDLEADFTLIEAIIKKRIENGLSQSALAKKIGTKQSAISRLESGNYNPSIAFLDKVAKGLGVKLMIKLA